MNSICYVDMDGVLVDFAGAVANRWGYQQPKNAHIDSWQIEELYGISQEEFWKSCNGHDFWVTMKEYPWAFDLVELVDTVTDGNWRFLTSPMRDPGCFSGKAEFIMTRWPEHFSKLMICGLGGSDNEAAKLRKATLCRSKYDYLIDDSEKNIVAWEEAGGSFFKWQEVTADFKKNLIWDRFDQIREDLEKIRDQSFALV